MLKSYPLCGTNDTQDIYYIVLWLLMILIFLFEHVIGIGLVLDNFKKYRTLGIEYFLRYPISDII